jgi:predicted GNAT family N-acyltransferase
MTTTDSSISSYQSQPSIEYAKIDYKNLPRRQVQPTGHSKIYFLPNPKISMEQYNIVSNSKTVLDSVKTVNGINIIDFDKSRINFDKLQNKIFANSLCRNIPNYYVGETLEQNDGILFISKNILDPDYSDNEDIIAFATIKLVNDNRYNNNRYLEVQLICSSKKYKHMGTKMLDALLDIAKNMDCKYIHLEAIDNVVEFYKKFGFVEDMSKFVIKKKGTVEMEFKILSEEDYKESSKYKENYGTIQEYGGRKKRKTNKRKTNKRKTNKRKTNKRKN